MSREGFTNAIVGGAETLIRSAIKSVNYILGVAGWRISRDGVAEFSNLTARGSITSGNRIVLINNGGVAVEDATHEFEINLFQGFLARKKPGNGQEVFIQSTGIYFRPEDPSPGGIATDAGYIVQSVGGVAPAEYTFLQIASPEINAKDQSRIILYSQIANDAGVDDTSHVDVFADNINFFVGSTHPTYNRGEYGSFLLSFGPANSATVVVTYAKTYANPPLPHLNIDSGSGTTARWVARAIGRTATQFTYFVFAADAVANTWVNVSCSWDVTEQP